MNPFGHMDLRVSELERALPFYEALLPALGFTEQYHGEQWKGLGDDGAAAVDRVLRDHRECGAHSERESDRLLVANNSEVDRIAEVARSAGQRYG